MRGPFSLELKEQHLGYKTVFWLVFIVVEVPLSLHICTIDYYL